MNSRLQQFLDLEDLTPARLADMLGVQRSGLSHILSGRNKPGFDFLYKLLTKFPEISADWLMTGKGKPYKELNRSRLPVENRDESFSDKKMYRQPELLPEKSQNPDPVFSESDRLQQTPAPVSFREEPQEQPPISTSAPHPVPEPETGFSETNRKKLMNIQYDNISNVGIQSDDILYTNLAYDGMPYNNILSSNEPKSDSLFPENSFQMQNSSGSENFQRPENKGYITDKQYNTPKNEIEQPSENPINETNRTGTGKKRSVKRVIIFYDDDSFEELNKF